MRLEIGDWCHSLDHDEPCRVIELLTLWGAETARVWLSSRDSVARVRADRLRRLDASPTASIDYLSYVCAASRIVDALARSTLVSPLEGSVTPLPHQLHALQRAMSDDRIRYLLADEVGLGKTIEAGLILREIKVRGLVKRILVVAPAGLVSQWVSEMATHFSEEFRLVQPSNFGAWRELTGKGEDDNLWLLHDQVVTSLDSVKPMEARRGWSKEQLATYNRERFEDLVAGGWDLVIVDEAHRLGGSTEQVARYKLGHALSQSTPYLLLLSATPHQGKTDAFRRLISFLDQDALPDDGAVTKTKVAPYVIRTEKRHAIDAQGEPLFRPRFTQVVGVEWSEERKEQRALYDAVTEYVRDGYNRAMKEKNTAVGFLMVLFQRLVTSSTAAIRSALERRLEVLQLEPGQLSLFAEDVGDEWVTLDGQEQMESILSSRLKGLENERAEVELLLSAARRCEVNAPDVKAQTLLDWIQKLQREESDPLLKVLVFTEFITTQKMLAEFLEQRGYAVTCLNGSLDLEERRNVQHAFANDAQVLISTDAGGEGLNLQFCHVIVNYDLPWNPMKLEQRIGRVDRIGQPHIVRALNFALEDTVEVRVREVLEEKLDRILKEFGVDKLSDVLDSEEGGIDFEQLFVGAVLNPADAERRAELLAETIRHRAQAAHDGSKFLTTSTDLDPDAAQKIADHQLPFWTERMARAWLAHRGFSVSSGDRHTIDWGDDEVSHGVTFDRKEAQTLGLRHLTIENPRIRGLMQHLPQYAPGTPMTSLEVDGVSDKVAGIWSLWSVRSSSMGSNRRRIFPLFLDEEGRSFGPTARVIWERLLEGRERVAHHGVAPLSGEELKHAYDSMLHAAENTGEEHFRELQRLHEKARERERDKMTYAFEAKRRAIMNLGLPQVRDHRLKQLEREEREWEEDFTHRLSLIPELTPLVLVHIRARSAEGVTS